MKTINPQVSVVIPVYNQAQYLSKAIESVLGQTYQNFEIIIVDDGSTDDSSAIALQYGDAVRYIRQKNQGLAGARNTGISAAHGDTVCHLDSDDLWFPTYLENMMEMVTNHPEATVFYCQAQCIDANGNAMPQLVGGPVVQPDDIYHKLLRANFLIPSTILMRRSAILAAGLFDVAFRRLQDWELWIRLLKTGHHFVGLADVLVGYRIHNSSLSTDPLGGQQAAMAIAVKHFGPDDGQWQTWSTEKQRAYGGIYRYHLLTAVQRQNDWKSGARYLCQALQADPTLAVDLSLFYDLALGPQQVGYRGSSYQLNLKENATQIDSLFANLPALSLSPELKAIQNQAHGTAHYALGLVAYNTGCRQMSRKFLVRALFFRPELLRDRLVIGNMFKSFLGRRLIAGIKKFVSNFAI